MLFNFGLPIHAPFLKTPFVCMYQVSTTRPSPEKLKLWYHDEYNPSLYEHENWQPETKQTEKNAQKLTKN